MKMKTNKGFSLVELIVVIAIMAIIAAVAVPVYSTYIDKANKGKDTSMIGEIIRAIEVGTNSTMFATSDSFTKGETTYPVGIIILTQDGCKVMTTSAHVVSTQNNPCEIKQIQIVPEGAYSVEEKKYLTALVDIYTIDESKMKTVDYCVTHANINVCNVPTSMSWKGPSDYKGYTFEKDCKGVYGLCGDHISGQVLTSDNLSSYGNIVSVEETGVNAIYDALNAAFGDINSLSLTYSDWGNTDAEGHTYATLLTFTEGMIGDIKDIADALILAVDAGKIIGKDYSDYLTEDYANAADMMDSFANHVLKTYPVYDDPTNETSDWKAIWESAASGSTTYAFGISSTKDYCYAARIAYNTAFASYCSVNGINNTYIEVLKDYSHKAGGGLISIPDVTNSAAFASKDASNQDSLYAQFIAKGDDGTVFDKCAKLFETYKNSDACEANGEIFYKTMSTVKQTGGEAYKSGNGGADSYFNYYQNYMKEMGAYYDFIKGYRGSGIIILVSVEESKVICEVSPSSANPRN